MVMVVTLVDSGDTFTQINQGYFTGTGAVSHMIPPVPEGYGWKSVIA